MTPIQKCDSCGGDMYHYAGCGVGEHGERLPFVSALPPVTQKDLALAINSYLHKRHGSTGFYPVAGDAARAVMELLEARGASTPTKCPVCASDKVAVEAGEARHVFGETVVFPDEFSRCTGCGEEFYTSEQSRAHTNAFRKACRGGPPGEPGSDTRPYKLTYEQADEALHEWLARMDSAECFPGITEEMLDPMTLAWQEAYCVGRGTVTP